MKNSKVNICFSIFIVQKLKMSKSGAKSLHLIRPFYAMQQVLQYPCPSPVKTAQPSGHSLLVLHNPGVYPPAIILISDLVRNLARLLRLIFFIFLFFKLSLL
ncbi:hypothetical protein BKM63_16355 [Flavobacterium johnsoniae]|uniref:Uncharacterized protein n=1 Tax=Flavobacterium johnsoniae TaxID=986 RepID=A0A1J7CFZ1_FLAJO|nr:hypothetical protein BKM63_16355 [Flavobacterium johnsoniae]